MPDMHSETFWSFSKHCEDEWKKKSCVDENAIDWVLWQKPDSTSTAHLELRSSIWKVSNARTLMETQHMKNGFKMHAWL